MNTYAMPPVAARHARPVLRAARIAMLTGLCALAVACGGGNAVPFGSGTGTIEGMVLSVAISGNGTVSSTPSGISCGSTCSGEYAAGTTVTLTAVAGNGSTFSTWTGACSGSATTCSVAVSDTTSVGAVFTTTTTGGGGSGGGASSGTPDWTRYETQAPWNYQAEVVSRSACGASEGTTYEVGPGKAYTRAAQVPWLKLVPCDQVLFYYSSTPYTDIVFVGSRGEKNKWITIAGVAGPNGERPVFDGNGAIMPTGTGANSYTDSAGLIEVVVPDSSVVSRAAMYKPGYLHITGLKFQNAHPSYKVTKLSGSTSNWAEFSSGIYLVGTEHVVIDDCEFTNNGLGVFANSGGDQYMQNYGLTISYNYFHGNGIAGKASEHNAYTEGIGTIYEYNYFGAPVTGTGGDNIKERSAGVIFRYNYIEDGVTLIALRDPESNGAYEAAALDAQGEKLVSKAFIYSNILVARKPTIYSDAPVIVGHGDGFSSNHRRYGYVYFYGNRVISTLATGTQLPATPVFDLLNTKNGSTTVVARNNLFYASASSGTTAPFALYYWQGLADWNSNWINKFQNVYASAADGGLAAGTKFDGSGLGGLATQSGDPGFVSFSTSNFLTTSSSPFAALNGSLPTAVTVRGLAPAGNPVVTPFGK